MITPDIGNALFELIGSWFTWRNAYQLWADKKTRGVYWPSWVFFSAWGLWNLYYYPALEQWFSFAAGVVLVGGNILWCILAYKYRRN